MISDIAVRITEKLKLDRLWQLLHQLVEKNDAVNAAADASACNSYNVFSKMHYIM